MKKFKLFTILLAALFSSVVVAQVYRADDGLGGALVVPYWTVSQGNATLLSIRNESDAASALKVHVLNEQGDLLESVNLYLAARSVWAAATILIGDETQLLFHDEACVLPTQSITSGSDSLPFLTLGARRGSLEIIEMATAGDDFFLVESGSGPVRWSDCDLIAEEFEIGAWFDAPNAGLSAPAQMISASATLINVDMGTMNAVPATALGGFSDAPLHSAPESGSPDLSDGVDSGASEGRMRSLVCAAGACRVEEWAQPVEAVAAALTASTMSVGYSSLIDLAAGFEWILHRPLKRYEAQQDGFVIGSEPAVKLRSRTGKLRGGPGEICIGTPPPGTPPCGSGKIFIPADETLQSVMLTTGPTAGPFSSRILGHPDPVQISLTVEDAEFLEGTAELALGNHDQSLTAADGTRFLGEPMITFAVQQFTNGTLIVDGQNVLSNYRGTELPRRILELAPP